jgi:DNA polymerase II
MDVRGFVLEPTWQTSSGRAVVHLYGRLEDGRPFLVRDRRTVPRFFVEEADAPRARDLGARPVVPAGLSTLEGRPVCVVEAATPSDVPPLRDRLRRAGITCHEADVRFAMRYLIDRGIRGGVRIRGEATDTPGTGLVFDDPEIAPEAWAPRLSVLSIDLETDPTGSSLLSLALHGAGASDVLLLTPAGAGSPPGAVPCASERDLLLAFEKRVREIDPDVLTGWNVVDFDLAVLDRAARRLGVRLQLGRGTDALRVRAEGPRLRATITGRVVLDGIALLRGAFVHMEDYRLDAVARQVLGEGKLLAGEDRAGEVMRLFREDRQALVDYNRTDARLALAIVEKRRLVELSAERSLLTGLPLDRVSGSIAAFDSLYLGPLRRRGRVAPSVTASHDAEPQEGGHVLEPVPGLHANVVAFDFRSLYPSLIRTFGIDPLTLVRHGDPGDAVVAPSGAAFRREPGILPSLLDEILPQRAAARAAGDSVKSHAIKILMNSFYGVLGTPASRFYDPRLANAITGFGRYVLLFCRDRLEALGHRVLYGDTDSLFVASGAADAVAAREIGTELLTRVGQALADEIRRRHRVESRLELSFDRLYRRIWFPTLRHGTAGARKRYAGLAEDGQVVLVGLEAARGDWTALAREVQRELFRRLFAGEPLEEYLARTVADLRAGRFDDRLVYRKALRKAPDEYTATTPPHVAAARLSGRVRGRMEYVVTTSGPQPAAAPQAPLDHEHYVQKQVRPVAEPLLALQGLDFATVVGDARQLSLF